MTLQKQNNPFHNLILDDYEKEIEQSIARDEWTPVDNPEEMKRLFQEAAVKHKELQKAKKITIRVNQADLIKLKAKANRKNIPYQTLLSALIRDFVEGDYSIHL